MPARPLRILVLHGYVVFIALGAHVRSYAQSAASFAAHLRPLVKALHGIAVLDFADGTFPARSADETASSPSEREDPMRDVQSQPRMWWHQATGDYRGADVTLARFANVLAAGQYDGIFGFSAGGALAILLSALSCDPSLAPAFADELGDRPLSPLHFAIVVGGYQATDPTLTPCYETPIAVPSLHVIGAYDAICWPGASISRSGADPPQNGLKPPRRPSRSPSSSFIRAGTSCRARASALRLSTLFAQEPPSILSRSVLVRCTASHDTERRALASASPGVEPHSEPTGLDRRRQRHSVCSLALLYLCRSG